MHSQFRTPKPAAQEPITGATGATRSVTARFRQAKAEVALADLPRAVNRLGEQLAARDASHLRAFETLAREVAALTRAVVDLRGTVAWAAEVIDDR